MNGLHFLSSTNPVFTLFTLIDLYEGDVTKDQEAFINSVNVSAT